MWHYLADGSAAALAIHHIIKALGLGLGLTTWTLERELLLQRTGCSPSLMSGFSWIRIPSQQQSFIKFTQTDPRFAITDATLWGRSVLLNIGPSGQGSIRLESRSSPDHKARVRLAYPILASIIIASLALYRRAASLSPTPLKHPMLI
jgi:hypothetical protein